MSDQAVVNPTDVFTMPWEKSGGDPDPLVTVASLKAKLDEEEESAKSDTPESRERPAEDAGDSKPADKSDKAEEDTPDDDPESDPDEEGEKSDEDEDEDEERAEPEYDMDEVIDLGDEKVTRRELKDRGLRQADYTRKTQAVAQERAEVHAARDEYKGKLEVLHGVLEKAKGPEVDWAKLARENPTEYAAKRAEHDEIERQQKIIEAEHQRVSEQQRAEFEKAKEEHIERESRLLVEALPAWKDPKVAEKEQGEIIDYAKKMGFTDEQIDDVADHRVFVMLHKAMQFDKLQAERDKVAVEVKEKLENPKKKPNKPGPKKGPKARSKAKEAELQGMRAKLAETGDIRVAGAVFAEYLRDLE